MLLSSLADRATRKRVSNMIKLDIACYGYTVDDVTLFGVVLRSSSGEEIKKTFRLKPGTTLNVAELHAFEYAFKSIKYPNEAEVTMFFPNPYISNILHKRENKYVMNVNKNADFVKSVRNMREMMPYSEIISHKTLEICGEVQTLVKEEAKRITNELAGNKGNMSL